MREVMRGRGGHIPADLQFLLFAEERIPVLAVLCRSCRSRMTAAGRPLI